MEATDKNDFIEAIRILKDKELMYHIEEVNE